MDYWTFFFFGGFRTPKKKEKKRIELNSEPNFFLLLLPIASSDVTDSTSTSATRKCYVTYSPSYDHISMRSTKLHYILKFVIDTDNRSGLPDWVPVLHCSATTVIDITGTQHIRVPFFLPFVNRQKAQAGGSWNFGVMGGGRSVWWVSSLSGAFENYGQSGYVQVVALTKVSYSLDSWEQVGQQQCEHRN